MKTHEERMHELLYDCEGIVEKSERICKLEEENAKLREREKSLSLRLILCEDENDALRELVRDMYSAFQRIIPDGHRLDFELRFDELGIEVES